jgi:hypothetical protein
MSSRSCRRSERCRSRTAAVSRRESSRCHSRAPTAECESRCGRSPRSAHSRRRSPAEGNRAAVRRCRDDEERQEFDLPSRIRRLLVDRWRRRMRVRVDHERGAVVHRRHQHARANFDDRACNEVFAGNPGSTGCSTSTPALRQASALAKSKVTVASLDCLGSRMPIASLQLPAPQGRLLTVTICAPGPLALRVTFAAGDGPSFVTSGWRITLRVATAGGNVP